MWQGHRRGVSTDLVDLTDEMRRQITGIVCKLRCSRRLGDSVDLVPQLRCITRALRDRR